jgi:hypothetical protein
MCERPGDPIALLKAAAYEDDCSMDTARRLVTAILERFPDADEDERFKDLMLILALYEPEPPPGEWLVGREELAKECRHVLNRLQGLEE